MAKGLAWVDATSDNSGKVLILTDDGTEELIPTILYAVSDIEPMLHELPLRATVPDRSSGGVGGFDDGQFRDLL